MTEVVDVPVIYEGIWVDDIHLGGMSIEEAKSVLAERTRESLEEIKFELIHNDKRWTITYKDIGAYIDWDKKIDQAYQIAREGELEERYNRIKEIEANGVRLKTSLFYNMNLVRNTLESIARKSAMILLMPTLNFSRTGKTNLKLPKKNPDLRWTLTACSTSWQKK